MRLDRQHPGLTCRAGMMGAVVILGLCVAQTGRAELGVALSPAQTATLAPARLVVTASVSGDDPIIEYAWQGLDAWPRCQGPRCDLVLALAACRRIFVQVTGLSGEVATAEAQVCLGDAEGAPPRAQMDLQPVGGGLRVRRGSTEGGAQIISSRLFVDQAEVQEPFAFIDPDAGCHALDLIVIDAQGRTGEDRRTFCFEPGAPEVYFGASPEAVTAEPEQRLCARYRHPLGLSMTQVLGPPVPDQGCADPSAPPSRWTREVIAVQDAADSVSVASLVTVRAPDQGPPTLPWLARPDAPLNFDQTLELTVFGGQGPFVVKAELFDDAGRVAIEVEPGPAPRQVRLRLPARPLIVVPQTLHLEVEDARGLSTELQVPVVPVSPQLDAGVSVDGGGPVPQASLAACTNAPMTGAAPLLLLVWGLGLRRRRE